MPKVIFNNKNALFFQSLKEATDTYFTENGIKKTGNAALYSKTIILICLALASYSCIMFLPLTIWLTIVASIFFGLVCACIGFNVMHDANHGSYSANTRVNNLLGLSLNALGGNNFIWKQKHNVIHHTYPNVDGVDADIAKNPLIRMCSTQRWMPMHRAQHIYAPLLYTISSLIWILFQDFEKYFTRKVNNTPLSDMKWKDHFIFWSTKVLYVFFYILLPMLLLGWAKALIFFLCLHAVLGFTTSIVFQLAHLVEDTEFGYASTDETTRIENEWAIHQVKTTSDFSPRSSLISWLVGGLNYQVEHHLFPRISHIHYPALSDIVRKQCEAFNVRYNCLPSMRRAVLSHFRLIKLLGKKPETMLLA